VVRRSWHRRIISWEIRVAMTWWRTRQLVDIDSLRMRSSQEKTPRHKIRSKTNGWRAEPLDWQTIFWTINGYSQALHANTARLGAKQDNVILQSPGSKLILVA
jgi:hypothetical protein